MKCNVKLSVNIRHYVILITVTTHEKRYMHMHHRYKSIYQKLAAVPLFLFRATGKYAIQYRLLSAR